MTGIPVTPTVTFAVTSRLGEGPSQAALDLDEAREIYKRAEGTQDAPAAFAYLEATVRRISAAATTQSSLRPHSRNASGETCAIGGQP